MKFFSEIQQVNLDKKIVLLAWDFAGKVTATTNYSDSNQTLLKKIKDDHFVSKLGEEACKIVFSKYANVAGPDYTIYPGDRKSWQEDLMIDSVGLAVKTQRRTAAKKYSLSWTFQYGAKRKDTLLHNPEAWVVFVEYDDTAPYNCYIYPPYQIKNLIFQEPKLLHLKNHKKVVYAAMLPK